MATTKDTITKNFKRGLWTEDMLVKLVVKGKLSAMDFAEIVGSSISEAELTEENIQKVLTNAVQAYMDETAQTRNYDNIHTACSYVNSTDEIFAAEGAACLAWRDAVWRKCYDILAEVKAGNRAIPTVEELIAELPVLDWQLKQKKNQKLLCQTNIYSSDFHICVLRRFINSHYTNYA